MVHTRHSYVKDHDEGYHELNGHHDDHHVDGHDDHIEGAIDADEEIHHQDDGVRRTRRQTVRLSSEINKQQETHDNELDLSNGPVNTEESKISKNVVVVNPEKRMRRAVVSLYDFAEREREHDSMTRRSLRNISREHISRNPYDSRPRKRNRITSQLVRKRYGCSLIRKSDRQPKKRFETFNEVEIQKSIDRKHREMLALQKASMYDGIKRRREISGESEEEEDETEEEEEEEESEEEGEEEEEEQAHCGYSLRKTKPKTNMYQAPPHATKPRIVKIVKMVAAGRKRNVMNFGPGSPIHHIEQHMRIPQHSSSPNHRGYKRRRRTSSTSDSDDDQAAFDRRKEKSMRKSRSRCLPMNFQPDDVTGVLKNRERAHAGMPMGSSLADVDPMNIDTNTTFSDIGGLDHHVRALKEMVIFPLLYTEVFQKFNISPPRGVLFHGPPGTGKTLVARALANECSKDGKKVAFFMRKGADCLSKWVGESERQLRLLFDQAYTMRPSIIFFDEIDGIAPVRSTRQDQIHSSIVSTLLALMDGLDARGEIVVIGATNRLDAIDPALRRPGRFDREFLFSLPNKKARERIFEIHTASWQPQLSRDFLVELADKCVGYCGADIKAMCTETALFALRRRYPQIYSSKKKLQLDTNEIKVSSVDFKNAMRRIVPASHRTMQSPGLALPDTVKPLLGNIVKKCLEVLHVSFPPSTQVKDYSVLADEDLEHDDGRNIFERGRSRQRYSSSRESDANSYFHVGKRKIDKNITNRPRFLLHGEHGNGQTSYIAPALLYSMEHLTTHALDLPSLFGNSARTPEETVAQVFREARRTTPCIVYLPHIGTWWQSVSETTRATFVTLLHDVPAGSPIFFLATAEEEIDQLPEQVQELFSTLNNEHFEVKCPASSERHAYFKDLLLDHALQQPDVDKTKELVEKRNEVLREASPPKSRSLTSKESKALLQQEETVLRELRLFLREITWKLLADRKFKEFSKPVDLGEVDDYLEIIKAPMDLSMVMTRINSHHYNSCAHFLKDVDLITNNCLEYNPDVDQFDKFIRNRACEMRDTAYSMVYDVLDPEFDKTCIEIHESRKSRESEASGLKCDHTIKNLSANYCAYCEIIYDKKKEKVDWLECRACNQWYHETCFCKYSPREKESAVQDNLSAPPLFLKVLPKPPSANTSAHNTSSTTTTATKPLANIPDPAGSRFSRRVRGISESEKTLDDPEQLINKRIGKKRIKVATSDAAINDCDLSYDNASDCLNNTDHEDSNHGNGDNIEFTRHVSKGDGDVIQNGHVVVGPSEEVKGVKRNLEFENPAESKGLTDLEEAEMLLTKLVEHTYNNTVEKLQCIYTTLCRTISTQQNVESRSLVLEEVKEVIDKLA